MTKPDWISNIKLDGKDGASKDNATECKVDGQVVTDTHLLVDNGKTIYLCKDQSAVKELTGKLQKTLIKGAAAMDICVATPDASGTRTIKIKADPDLPWQLELFKNVTSTFLTAGAAALAASITSLIVGSPVTLWMFLAALVSLALGTLSHWGYLAFS
jgi:hypothetical protein